jgi:general secretion pathway protein L
MNERLLLLIPAVRVAGDPSAHWWRVSDERVLEQGSGPEWRSLARLAGGGGAGLPLVALAPAAAVRLSFPEPKGETDRQRLAIARSEALAASMAEPATLHAVSGLVEGRLGVAVVANGVMIEWLDWLTGLGVDPDAILPAGLLLPPSDRFRSAILGSESLIGRGDLVLPDEPPLREMFVGDEEPEPLSDQETAERLLWLAAHVPLNLRSGRFARRRLFVLDWRRVRELTAIAACIPLLGLIMAVVMIVRLNSASDRLEAETARLASAALGQEVTAANAASALDLRISEVPGASGSPFVPLAALYRTLQQVPGASASAVSWRPDGTLDASIAATRTEDINRVLLALQRSGFKVTATSRAGPTGQVIADITVRTGA